MRIMTAIRIIPFALCFPAAAIAEGDWQATTGLFQDEHNYRVWTPNPTPSSLEAGAGRTSGMTGNQAVYLKGDVSPKNCITVWCRRAEAEPQNSFINYGGLERVIPLEAWQGKRIRVTIRLKNEDGARAYASVQLNKLNNSAIRTTAIRNEPGGDWQTHQFVLNVPANAASLAIDVGLTGKGTVWLDGFSIAAVSDQMPLSTTSRVEVAGPAGYLNGIGANAAYGAIRPMPGLATASPKSS